MVRQRKRKTQQHAKLMQPGAGGTSLHSSLLPHGLSQQQCSQRVLGNSCKSPHRTTISSEWGTVDSSARECESQAALILGTDHILTLRKVCSAWLCNGEPWRNKTVAYPQSKRQWGGEREREIKRERRGEEAERKQKEATKYPSTCDWCWMVW